MFLVARSLFRDAKVGSKNDKQSMQVKISEVKKVFFLINFIFTSLKLNVSYHEYYNLSITGIMIRIIPKTLRLSCNFTRMLP